MPWCRWRCRCSIVAVSQRDFDAGRTPTGEAMKKTAPDVVMRDWLDKRSGQIKSIPVGIDPGFGYNPGLASARQQQRQVVDDKLAALSPVLANAAKVAGVSIPAVAKAIADQPNWKSLGLLDLRTFQSAATAPEMLAGAASAEAALGTIRTALGIEAGGSVLVQTPVEMVMLNDLTLPHVVAKRTDQRERFANFILPTLRNPTEVWATRYDDATVRHRYIKLFAGAKYDLLVLVLLEPDGSIFWNMMQRDRKGMNVLREGDRIYDGT